LGRSVMPFNIGLVLSIVEAVVIYITGAVASCVTISTSDTVKTDEVTVRLPSLREDTLRPATDHDPLAATVALPLTLLLPSVTVTVTVLPTALALVPDTVTASSSRLLKMLSPVITVALELLVAVVSMLVVVMLGT